VIAVDTNILVYAHRRDSKFHAAAFSTLKGLAEGRAPWAVPWPCLHEFYSVATHPRLYDPPSTTDQAVAQIEAWLDSPSIVTLAEATNHWPTLQALLAKGKVTGPMVHDAKIAALCLNHGVRELWTIDRDFGRFPDLTTRNPLPPRGIE
jgi:toxin-antitoxin system PIN domain toxin